ncbi:MAG: C25 family cysteine peptidase [Planctomycetia bacterium]|nr:C25 family cysteine peptidase [Planctomycetia bacterium]
MNRMKIQRFLICALLIVLGLGVKNLTQSCLAQDSSMKLGYAIVATPAVMEDEQWKGVVDSLKAKREADYNVATILWDDNLLETLKSVYPRYVAFVMKPEEASIERSVAIWRLSRQMNDDPYGDFLWGIITGFEPKDALRLTQVEDMLVTRALGGTSIALDYFESGVVFDEGKKNHWRVKEPGQEAVDKNDAPDDTTHAIAEALNDAQLFVTSGHASERNWSIGYAYKNGFFVAQNGNLYGAPSNDKPFEIHAQGSKIHLASGNCLLGHVDKPDCLALALMRNANVDMLVGYLVPTWFGYMGWGIQDYYIEQPGRYTVAEAFYANNQALLYLLEQETTKAASEEKASQENTQFRQGLAYDRDVVVLYGDPAWRNPLKTQDSGWKQELVCEKNDAGKDVWRLTITPLKGEKTYGLLDGNGSERSGRPVIQIFPQKIDRPVLVEGSEFAPVLTENFILIPLKELQKNLDQPTVITFTSQDDAN